MSVPHFDQQYGTASTKPLKKVQRFISFRTQCIALLLVLLASTGLMVRNEFVQSEHDDQERFEAMCAAITDGLYAIVARYDKALDRAAGEFTEMETISESSWLKTRSADDFSSLNRTIAFGCVQVAKDVADWRPIFTTVWIHGERVLERSDYPLFLKSVELSRDSTNTITSPFTLGPNGAPANLISVQCFYDVPESELTTEELRRVHLRAFAWVISSWEELLRDQCLKNTAGRLESVSMKVADRQKIHPVNTHPPFSDQAQVSVDVHPTDPFQRRFCFNLPGIELDMMISATPLFFSESRRAKALVYGLAGFGITLLIGVMMWRAASANVRLEQLVFQRTAELRATLQQAEAVAHEERQLNSLKSDFISMVSHELRTPLQGIISSADILSRYNDRLNPEARAERFSAIQSGVSRIAKLTEDVLLQSKLESGQQAMEFEPLDLAEWVKALVHEVRSAMNERCPILVDVSAPLAERADEALLRHIFVNLLSNAIKYSRPNSPIFVRAIKEVDDAVFTVSDRGCGIDQDDLQRVLSIPFVRGRNVQGIEGTGLGMTIVRRSVRILGGRFSVESQLGVGTSVTVRLPLYKKPLS